MYIFVPIHTLQIPIRNLLTQLLTLVTAESFECLLLREFLGLYESTDFLNFVPEGTKSSYAGIQWIGYFDYKQNFAANFRQDFITLANFAFKLLLLKLVGRVPIPPVKKLCQKILRQKAKLFLFELVAINPTVALGLGNVLGSAGDMQAKNFWDKVNLCLIITLPFFFLISVFGLLIVEIEEVREKEAKNTKREAGSKPDEARKNQHGNKPQ